MGHSQSSENNRNENNNSVRESSDGRRGSDEDSVTSQEGRVGSGTSTGGLQILLQQPFLRANFRGFVSSQWTPSENNSNFTNYAQTNPRKIALNCIDFWTDAQDLSYLSESSFASFRAYYIYEKYIVHACNHPVPLSMNTIDDCSESIICSTGKLNSTLFAAAEAEALDFLIAEVYPMFERTTLAVNISRSDRNKGEGMFGMSIPLNHRRKSLFKSPDRNVLISMMQKILSDPTYLSLFKTYMISKNTEILLYGYNDVVELKEKVTQLQRMEPLSPRSEIAQNACLVGNNPPSQKPATDSPTGNNTQRAICSGTAGLEVFFSYVNNFYDTYLALGARFRLPMSEILHEEVRDKICRCVSVDANLLETIETYTFETLIREHLDNFLNTAEYRYLVRAGRGSIMILANGLHDRLQPDPSRRESMQAALMKQETVEQTNSYFGGSADTIGESNSSNDILQNQIPSPEKAILAAIPHRSTLLANSVAHSDPSEVISRVQLKNFIHSPHHMILGRYLAEQSKLSLMYFYQSALSFQAARFRNELERIAAARQIFDRYVSRNSDEFIGLPNDMRADIITGLMQASSLLFKEAADVTFVYLHDNHWKAFKHQVYRKGVADLDLKHATNVRSTNCEANDKDILTNASAGSSNEDACKTDVIVEPQVSHPSETGATFVPATKMSVEQQQQELLERQYPSHSDGFVKLALICFPEIPDNSPVDAALAENNQEPPSKVKVTPPEKRRTFLPSLFGLGVGKSATVIPISASGSKIDASPVSEKRRYSLKTDRIENSLCSLADALRENCQQFRRRSMAHEADPFVIAAEDLDHADNPHRQTRNGTANRRGSSLISPAREEEVVLPTLAAGFSTASAGATSKYNSIEPRERRRLVLSVLSHPQCCGLLKLHLEATSTSQTILFIIELEE